MFSKALVSAAFAATALAQTFSVNTPASLVQCQPASVSWTGGMSPFVLSAIPAGQVSAPAIEYIATGLTASPYAWNVNLAAGTNITLRLADAGGNNVYASPLVIQTGPSNSCLNASASTSGLTTASVSATSAGGGGVASSGAASSGTASSMMASSASMAMTSAASASGGATSAAGSAASAASSAAASATSKAGAFATAVAGVPAIALAAFGGIAALL